MVRLSYLDHCTVYRATSPIVMPETDRNRKKGKAYIVLAPTMEQGLKFLSTTNKVLYRNLTKYYVPKKWSTQLYKTGLVSIRFDTDGEITAMLKRNHTGNLKDIDAVSCFIPGNSDPLKGFNVLVETNYVFERVLGNPKDTRRLFLRIPGVIDELSNAVAVTHQLGNYHINVLIPMELWFKKDEYSNPDSTWKTTSTNPMAHILRELTNSKATFSRLVGGDLYDLTLLDGSTFMTISPVDVLGGKADDYTKYTRGLIKQFMKRAKTKREDDITIADSVDDDGVDDPTIPAIKKAEQRTDVALVKEEITEKLGIDEARLGDDMNAKVEKVAKKVVEQSSTPKAALVRTADDDVLVGESPESVVQGGNVDSSDVDVLLAAKMAGRSVESQKRNEMLKKKYADLKMGDVPLKELIEEEKRIEIPEVRVGAHTINPALEQIKGQRFEEAYENELMQQDLVSILLHFSSVSPALYLNKDIKIEDVSTRTDRVLRYTVEYEDENRKRHRFSFRLPKMYRHKYLFLNGQELVITHQKLPFPITKVSADRCQLVTNYNKIFIYRYGTALSPRMVRLKKLLSGNALPNVVTKRGNCIKLNNQLTSVEFDELASNFVYINIGRSGSSIKFIFDPDLASVSFDFHRRPDAYKEYIPLAVMKEGTTTHQYWLDGTSNKVYPDMGDSVGELSEFMTEMLIKYSPTAEKELAETAIGTKFMYSKARIMSQDIPLVLVMGAADPDGLTGALAKGNVQYSFVDKRPSVDKTTTGVIPFADGYLVFDRYPYENSLLLNGLLTFPTKEYNFYDLNTRDAYVEIFDNMCGQRTLADNFPAFYYMMVDPITADVLRRLGLPTDFISLLFYCNGTLADNAYQIDSDYDNSRIRSTEIIMAHLYRELAVAWSNFRSGRTDTFSIPENAIITLLLTSKIIDPKSKLNISLELESDRNVKLKGPSGMNEDHSFTIEKRAYHPSMRGIVATNSTPSGEVGINRHLVINPGIVDARGFIDVNRPTEYDGTELMSPGEALSPFGAESADIERLCMSISQAKHLVPVASQCSSPISFDFERVAPYLSSDFAFQAKKDGKVVEIADDLMIIQYSDGTYDDIDLSTHPAKNTDGGFYIMNNMSTNLKIGSKFKAGQILAYDKKYINDLDFFGDPCANVGTLARVAFESNGSVYEDSGYITDAFAHRFATKITKQKRVILSGFANIKHIAKVGQTVQANDPILVFDDTEDEFSAQLLASIADQMDDQDEVIGSGAPVVSKYAGVVRDIDITYTIPIESMTPSLQKIVKAYAHDAGKREKTLGKYIDVRDSNTIVKNSERSVPDSRGKVGGVKIGDGVIIDFYIEYEDVAGNGDKGSIGALKFTTCEVIPTELAGYTESNEERKIDVYVASFGAFKRMVADVEKIGILTKILVEEKRRMKEKYGQRVKAELKKQK